jgi:hypothetical protein
MKKRANTPKPTPRKRDPLGLRKRLDRLDTVDELLIADKRGKHLVTVNADAVLILDERERDTINTMIDFFRSSGEDQSLDPEVYEGIAEKLGNERHDRERLLCTTGFPAPHCHPSDECINCAVARQIQRAVHRFSHGVKTDGSPLVEKNFQLVWEVCEELEALVVRGKR